MRVAQGGLVAFLDFVVNFLTMNRHFQWSIDPDLNRAAFEAQDGHRNPAINYNVLTRFARKDKHNNTRSRNSGDREGIGDTVAHRVVRNHLLADHGVAVEDEGTF
jgi:hypothetical protein